MFELEDDVPMYILTTEEEMALENFFDEESFIVAPGKEDDEPYYCFDWDGDWRKDPEFLTMFERAKLPENHPDKVYVYTLIEVDGEAYVTEGNHLVNRVGYFFSKKYFKLEKDLRYW